MKTLLEPVDKNWSLILDDCFQNYDDFAQSIRGWGIDFRQLKPGQFPAYVQQFGATDLMVSRFDLSQSYDQSGSTPSGMLSIGFIENGAGKVHTPEGTVSEKDIWCFSAGQEFECTSQADFRAFGLSISETLLDEVADTCELADTHSSLGSNQIVRCQQREKLDRIRHNLVEISQSFRNNSNEHPTIQAYQHDMVRELLETLSSSQKIKSLVMTKRKRLVLRRTLDYLEANPGTPIAVHQLAKETGAGVRTLEYVFRDYFGVTPKAYLSARRLAGARRELQTSDIKTTLIRDIAYRWGFWHLGRFSADYRRYYGESPSETLERKWS